MHIKIYDQEGNLTFELSPDTIQLPLDAAERAECLSALGYALGALAETMLPYDTSSATTSLGHSGKQHSRCRDGSCIFPHSASLSGRQSANTAPRLRLVSGRLPKSDR